MLRINRLKITIITEKGKYGFDENFNSGLNIIASDDNTSGKSSLINGLYYALGFEQLIEGSGTGSKTLSQAFTKNIKIENGEEVPVLESNVQLEISNGKEVITIKRYAKHGFIKDNLIVVYFSNMNQMHEIMTKKEEMYVHMPGSAQNIKGFHKYLEEFLGLKLPIVAATNGGECKLYLQAIFGALFIEQKHGWSGFLNGVPYLGVLDVKKRIVEYLLGLSSLEEEKARKKQKRDEQEIQDMWKQNTINIVNLAKRLNVDIENIPKCPILEKEELCSIKLIKEQKYIDEYVQKIREKSKLMSGVEPKLDSDSRLIIEKELKETRKAIDDLKIELERIRIEYKNKKVEISNLEDGLELIQIDLLNNKESKRLMSLGAGEGVKNFDHLCPTCGQKINDSLFKENMVMSIDENIAHLQSQEKLFEFAIQGKQKALFEVEKNIQNLEDQINKLLKLQSVLSGDLIKIKGEYTYSNAYQKIKLDLEIEEIEEFIKESKGFIEQYIPLIEQWKTCLSEKSKLGPGGLSIIDKNTLKNVGAKFTELLIDFGYRSTSKFDKIMISEDSFLPTLNGFDMRYDSSASDELRNIWAFTLALMDVSIKTEGNHPTILIYDEPKQQSVIDDSFKKLCEKLSKYEGSAQIIIGVTAFDDGVKRVISELDKTKFNYINIGTLAFKSME